MDVALAQRSGRAPPSRARTDLGNVAALGTGQLIQSCSGRGFGILQSIARTGHRDMRLYFDEHFERAKCDLFYETWIENSFRGFAKAVVAEEKGKPVGCVTCHLPAPQESQIGIMEWRRSGRAPGSERNWYSTFSPGRFSRVLPAHPRQKRSRAAAISVKRFCDFIVSTLVPPVVPSLRARLHVYYEHVSYRARPFCANP